MIFQPVLNPVLLGIIFGGLTVTMAVFAFKNRKSSSLVWVWSRRILMLLLLGTMLLRPGVGETKDVDVYTSQYDIYFVVDTTASMVAEDWGSDKETRLTGVKQDISRLVDDYSGARFALMTFDSEALIRTPLTKDSTALMSSVKNLSPEITKNSRGSNVWKASSKLEETLASNSATAPDRARIVFMFTDGENTSSDDGKTYSYQQSAQYINGGAVYGYGTEAGGKMKIQNGYFINTKKDVYILDKSKNPPMEALSKLDVKNLKKISEELGVTYVQRDADKPVQAPKIDNEELAVSSTSGMRVVNDLTWFFGMLFFALATVEFVYMLINLKRVSKEGSILNG